MNKVRQFSRSYIFLSLLYVALGIVLLIWPDLSLAMVGRGLGVILIVVGATCGVVYFTGDKRQEGFLQAELVIAIVCAAFGVFMLLTPEFMSMILPFAMATVLLVGAIVKIQSSISMRRLYVRHWYVALIAALIIIALGIFLLVFPFESDAQMLLYIGICLILDGLTNITGLLCIQIRTRKLANIQKKNPGVDVKALIEKEWEAADAAKAERKARKREKKNQKDQEIVAEAREVSPETGVVSSEMGMDASDTSKDTVCNVSEEAAVDGSEIAEAENQVKNPLIARARAGAALRKKNDSSQKDQSKAGNGIDGQSNTAKENTVVTAGDEPNAAGETAAAAAHELNVAGETAAAAVCEPNAAGEPAAATVHEPNAAGETAAVSDDESSDVVETIAADMVTAETVATDVSADSKSQDEEQI